MQANIEQNRPTSDHGWRSHQAVFSNVFKGNNHTVRIATWNMCDKFKQLVITDKATGEVTNPFNNPWNIAKETDEQYLTRKRQQLEEITNQIMAKADVITLQEANIITCLFENQAKTMFADPNTAKREKQLIAQYVALWKRMGYEVLPISRKVAPSAYQQFQHPEGEKDGWIQHLAIIYNARLLEPSSKVVLKDRLFSKVAVEPEPLFPIARTNKDNEPYQNYRGVGQEFTFIGKEHKNQRLFVFSMHLDGNLDNQQCLRSLLERKTNEGVLTLGAGDTNTTPGHNECLKLVNPNFASHFERDGEVFTITDSRSGHIRALDGIVAAPTKGHQVSVKETGGEAFILLNPRTVIKAPLEGIHCGYGYSQFQSAEGRPCYSDPKLNAEVDTQAANPSVHLLTDGNVHANDSAPSGNQSLLVNPAENGFFSHVSANSNNSTVGHMDRPVAVVAQKPAAMMPTQSSVSAVVARPYTSDRNRANDNNASTRQQAQNGTESLKKQLEEFEFEIEGIEKYGRNPAQDNHNIGLILRDMRRLCNAAGCSLETMIDKYSLENAQLFLGNEQPENQQGRKW